MNPLDAGAGAERTAMASSADWTAAGPTSVAIPATPMAPPPPPAVDAVFRVTLGDLFRASAEGARHSWLAAAFGFLFVYGAFFWSASSGWLTGAFIVVGFGFSTGWLSALLVVLGMSRRRDLLARDYAFHADAEGIRWVGPGTSTQAAWSVYARIRDMRHDFLLETGTGSAAAVPKEALGPDGVETFRGLARRAGLLSAGSSWMRPFIGYATGMGASALLYVGSFAILNG